MNPTNRFAWVAAVLALWAGQLHAETEQSKQTAAATTPAHQFYARVFDPIFNPKDDFKIAVKDYPNGVYVIAKRGSLFSKPKRFDKVEAILAERLKQKGFKIADNPEVADATVTAFCSIDFEEIQENKNDTLGRGLSIAGDIIGVVGSAKWTGGQSLMVNGINVQLHKKRHWAVFTVTGHDGKEQNGGLNVGVEYNEDTPVVSAALFELIFDEWAKRHLDLPQVANANGNSPASSVAEASAAPIKPQGSN
jgi:hypothetical protein